MMSLIDPGSIEYITMEDLWDKLEKRKIAHGGIKEQPAGPDYLYCDTEGLLVYDIRKPGFVKVSRVVKNKTSKWKVITISGEGSEYTLTCTLDHPFPIVGDSGNDKRVTAENLKEGQKIRIEKPVKDDKYVVDISREKTSDEEPQIIVATITSITDKDEDGYSYDITTESDHFTVNHIDSHNCRAFLSPYYERGGFYPADENDKPVFTGRWNGGVVSLHLPMILAKARKENKDFYEVLDYYLELIRGIHKRTKDYLGEMKASVNPLQFCEGGFYKGHLKPSDKIKPLLDYVTFSYGITALNELNRLYNGKSIREDGEFPLEVMEYINKKLDQFKKEDHILYAVYSTPAESLCGTQVKQFRKIYGIIENVSDREYVSNSFHCHVSEDMDPIEKQDKEHRFWNLTQGGRIQYVKYPIDYNYEAMATLVRRAMRMGLYEGLNMSLSYCDDCGHEELDMDECPVCNSKNIIKIERMNGWNR